MIRFSEILPWVIIAMSFVVVYAFTASLFKAESELPKKQLPGYVVYVQDGDSMEVHVDGVGRLSVRLENIDAPEYDQPWGEEATDALKKMTSHGKLTFRLLKRDSYGRVVAVVFAGDAVLNEAMVRQGHAWAYFRYMPDKIKSRYAILENSARESRRDLWSLPGSPVRPYLWREHHPRTAMDQESAA